MKKATNQPKRDPARKADRATSSAKAADTKRGKATSLVSAQPNGGIVYPSIHGKSKSGSAMELPTLVVASAVKAGLPIEELDDLRHDLDVPVEKLVTMLGISKAKFHRSKGSKGNGKLGVAESERVVRYAKLLGKAAAVMESVENGRRWLATPQFGLGGVTPLEFAETEVGAREVENLLGRIETGVY